MRRYFLVNLAKDANVFGIVVGTLAVGKEKEERREKKRVKRES
jgi:hypothetical protein